MHITPHSDTIIITKPEGLTVSYYLFDQYEVHYNEQPPNSTQAWHHHETIHETVFIIEGELTAKWKENGVNRERIVKAKDLIQTENTPHTFNNHTDR